MKIEGKGKSLLKSERKDFLLFGVIGSSGISKNSDIHFLSMKNGSVDRWIEDFWIYYNSTLDGNLTIKIHYRSSNDGVNSGWNIDMKNDKKLQRGWNLIEFNVSVGNWDGLCLQAVCISNVLVIIIILLSLHSLKRSAINSEQVEEGNYSKESFREEEDKNKIDNLTIKRKNKKII